MDINNILYHVNMLWFWTLVMGTSEQSASCQKPTSQGIKNVLGELAPNPP